LDFVKYFIDVKYHSGLKVVPIILMANFMFGIFFNLSLWYKLTDKTKYGALLAIIGSVITLAINIAFVPVYGYIASAWANFMCYFVMMVSSYFLLKKYYPVKYDLKRIALYVILGSLIYMVDYHFINQFGVVKYLFKGLLLTALLIYIIRRENMMRLFKGKVL
jgi:O-antigen/teichoic acid export membrane protein